MKSTSMPSAMEKLLADLDKFHSEANQCVNSNKVGERERIFKLYLKLEHAVDSSQIHLALKSMIKCMGTTMIYTMAYEVKDFKTIEEYNKNKFSKIIMQERITAEAAKFLKPMENKFPPEFLPYAKYIVFALCQSSVVLVNSYIEMVDGNSEKRGEMSNILMVMLKIQTVVNKFIEARKEHNGILEIAAKILLGNYSYLYLFQEKNIKKFLAHNYKTFKSFFEGKDLAKLYNAKRSAKNNNEKSYDLWVDLEYYCMLLSELSKNKTAIDKTIMIRIKEYDLDSLMSFIKTHAEIVGDLPYYQSVDSTLSVRPYAELIEAADIFVTYVGETLSSDKDLMSKVNKFKLDFYRNEIVSQYLGYEKCEKALNSIGMIESDTREEIIKTFDELCDEFNLYKTDTKNLVLKNGVVEKCKKINNLVIPLPKEHEITGLVYSALANFMGIHADKEKFLRKYGLDTAALLKIINDSKKYPEKHADLILNLAASTAWLCTTSFMSVPNNDPNPTVIRLLRETKEMMHRCFLDLKNLGNTSLDGSIIVFTANLCIIHGFINLEEKYNKDKKLSPFIDKPGFNIIRDKVKEKFSKDETSENPGKRNETCILYWLEMVEHKYNLVKYASINSFEDFDHILFLVFLNSFDLNVLSKKHDLKHPISGKGETLNIYQAVIWSARQLLDYAEAHLDEVKRMLGEFNIELKPEDKDWNVWLQYYIYNEKLLAFKSGYFKSHVSRYCYGEKLCDELIFDIDKKIKENHFYLSLMLQKLQDKKNQENNNHIIAPVKMEDKKEIKQLQQTKRKLLKSRTKYIDYDESEDKKIVTTEETNKTEVIKPVIHELCYSINFPKYVMNVFEIFQRAGINEVYARGEAVYNDNPYYYEIVVNASLEQIIKLLHGNRQLEFAEDGAYCIRSSNINIKEIRIRPMQMEMNIALSINTVCYDPINKWFVDKHEGVNDIEKKQIRLVGDMSTSIFEIIRLVGALQYSIDENTKHELETQIKSLKVLMEQDIKKFNGEFNRLLMEKNNSGILVLLEELNFFHHLYGFTEAQSKSILSYITSATTDENINKNPLLIWCVILNPVLHLAFRLSHPDEYHHIIEKCFASFGVVDEMGHLERLILLTYCRIYHPYSESQYDFCQNDYYLANKVMDYYSRATMKARISYQSQPVFFSPAVPFVNHEEIRENYLKITNNH